MNENMEWNNEIEEELIKPTEESKMSWMMKKGWNIGKKVMITGATISSAPIVLPPLMIYSTIGLAFAVPFGFVFGSYACTEKLMSKLLWRPDLEQQDQELVLEEEGYYGGDMMVMEEEEKRFIEDTKGTLETRIEFVRYEFGEENVGFGVEPVKEDSEEVIGDEEMGDSTGSDGNSFGVGEILEEMEEDLKRGIGEFGGNEISADRILEDERVVPIEVLEWNMGNIEVEDQPVRGLSDVLEEIREEILVKVLEDEQKMASVIDNGEIEEENLARERYGDVDEGRDEGNADVRVDEEETLSLQNMKGKVREEIEAESPLEMNVENIEEGMELEFDEQNDLTEDIREEEIQYEVLEDDEKKIVSELLNDGEAVEEEGMNEDVEENGVNVDVAVEEEGMPLLDVKEMVEEEIEGENLSEMGAEECREGLYVGDIEAKGMAEENVDERILVKDVAGDEKPVYEMHPFGGDISSELNFDDVAQEENYIVIEEGNRLIGADRVVEEERRDNENVDSIVAKEEPLMAEKLDDNEKVKAVSVGVAEAIIIKSGEGQNVDEHKEEEMPVEEAEGIRFEEETPVTREMRVGNILDGGGVVDEKKGEGIADSMALREMTPLRETPETRDVEEVADESVLHLYDENDVYGDNYATEAKNAREISDESGLHLYDEYDVYGDNYTSAANEVVPMSTSYNSFPFKGTLDNQSQPVNGSAVKVQSLDNFREELIAVSMVRPVSLEVEGYLKESEGVVKRIGDDDNVDVHKEEELPTEEAEGIQKDNSIEADTRVTRARGDGNIVDEVRDKEGKKPVKEAVGKMEVSADEQNGARIVIRERSGVFHARKDEGISDSKALKEKNPLRETEMVGLSSASQDARVVAEESGYHLYDKDNSYADKFASATNETLEDQVLPISTPYYTPATSAILDNQSRIVNGSSVEKQHLSKTLGEEIADSVVQPVSSEVADRGSVGEASMKKKTVLPSEQVFYSEEKIWEQICALRKIVGYQAVMQTTCVEELRALYVFTGVEPPFAFKDPADLEEINDKLRLLMLIVGVK